MLTCPTLRKYVYSLEWKIWAFGFHVWRQSSLSIGFKYWIPIEREVYVFVDTSAWMHSVPVPARMTSSSGKLGLAGGCWATVSWQTGVNPCGLVRKLIWGANLPVQILIPMTWRTPVLKFLKPIRNEYIHPSRIGFRFAEPDFTRAFALSQSQNPRLRIAKPLVFFNRKIKITGKLPPLKGC